MNWLSTVSSQLVVTTFFSLFSVSTALAEYETRNGGDVVVCDGHEMPELLDLYEGRTQLGLHYSNDVTQVANVTEILTTRLARLAELDPIRAMRYLTSAKRFSDLIFIMPSVASPTVATQAHVAPECQVVQVALQTFHLTQLRLHVVQSLWQRLSAFDYAALMLHEAILEDGLLLSSLQKSDFSKQVRQLTAHLLSDEFESISTASYKNLLQTLGFSGQVTLPRTNIEVRSESLNYDARFPQTWVSAASVASACEKCRYENLWFSLATDARLTFHNFLRPASIETMRASIPVGQLSTLNVETPTTIFFSAGGRVTSLKPVQTTLVKCVKANVVESFSVGAGQAIEFNFDGTSFLIR